MSFGSRITLGAPPGVNQSTGITQNQGGIGGGIFSSQVTPTPGTSHFGGQMNQGTGVGGIIAGRPTIGPGDNKSGQALGMNLGVQDTQVPSLLSGQQTGTAGNISGSSQLNAAGNSIGISQPGVVGGIFGASQPGATGGVFSVSQPGTAGSVFGTPNTGAGGGIFGTSQARPTGGVFSTPQTGTMSNVFGTSQPIGASGMFGTSQMGATGNTFGTPQPGTAGGIFGASQPGTTSGIFGTSQLGGTGGIFGTSQPGITASSIGTSQPGVIGNTLGVTQPGATSGIFGGFQSGTMGNTLGASQPGKTGGIFGTSQPGTTSSIFGTSQPGTTSNIFGTSQPGATSSIFGASQPGTTSNIFGTSQPGTTSNIFGTSQPGATSSIFGTSQPGATSSIFGTSQPGATSSIFGTSQPGTMGSIFGTSQPGATGTASSALQPAAMGSIFGQTPTTGKFGLFGASQAPAKPGTLDATKPLQQQTSAFGQSQLSSLGAVGQAPGSIFSTSSQPQISGTSNTLTPTSGLIFGNVGQATTTPASITPNANLTTGLMQKPNSPFGNAGTFTTPASRPWQPLTRTQPELNTTLFGSSARVYIPQISATSSVILNSFIFLTSNNAKATGQNINILETIKSLAAMWDPKSPSCIFRHALYNIVHPNDVSLYVPPPDTDINMYRQAMQNNPNISCKVPVIASGFDDIHKRVTEQEKVCQEQMECLESVCQRISEINRLHFLNTLVRIKHYKQRQIAILNKTLKIMMCIHIAKMKGVPLRTEELVILDKLIKMKNTIQKPLPLKERLYELQSQLQQVLSSTQFTTFSDSNDAQDTKDNELLHLMPEALSEISKGINYLTNTLQKCNEDCDVIAKGYLEASIYLDTSSTT